MPCKNNYCCLLSKKKKRTIIVVTTIIAPTTIIVFTRHSYTFGYAQLGPGVHSFWYGILVIWHILSNCRITNVLKWIAKLQYFLISRYKEELNRILKRRFLMLKSINIYCIGSISFRFILFYFSSIFTFFLYKSNSIYYLTYWV